MQLITNDFLPARRFTKLTPIRLLQLLALQCKRTITDVNRQSFTITLVITEIIIRASSAGSKSSPRAPRRCGRNGKHPKVPQLKAEGCWRSFELRLSHDIVCPDWKSCQLCHAMAISNLKRHNGTAPSTAPDSQQCSLSLSRFVCNKFWRPRECV